MAMVKIYGCSDDLIEIEGDIREEIGFHPHEDAPFYLAVSDGTILKVEYDGDWHFYLYKPGLSNFTKTQGEQCDYSDTITLEGGNIEWIALVQPGHLVLNGKLI